MLIYKIFTRLIKTVQKDDYLTWNVWKNSGLNLTCKCMFLVDKGSETNTA